MPLCKELEAGTKCNRRFMIEDSYNFDIIPGVLEYKESVVKTTFVAR